VQIVGARLNFTEILAVIFAYDFGSFSKFLCDRISGSFARHRVLFR